MKLVARNPYCPIGTKSNVRMLPKSFVKVCLAHQEKQKENSKEKAVISPGLFPCKNCPASEPISQGKDPVTVVSDIDWISIDEYQSIQSSVIKMKEVISKMEKAIDTINVTDNKKVAGLITQVKECLVSAESFISNAVSFLDQLDMEVGAKRSEMIDIATFKWPALPGSKVGKSYIIYDLCQVKGISRKIVASKYNISMNYIIKLISLYKKSKPVNESSAG